MREILFRGQTRRKGEYVFLPGGKDLPSKWVYGGIFPSPDSSIAIIYQQEPTIEKFPVHADTIGQYTGLKDKNGTRIFEGDILEYTNDDGEKSRYFIAWDENSAAFVIQDKIANWADNMDNWERHSEMWEIIGNIHDNPELLEGGDS